MNVATHQPSEVGREARRARRRDEVLRAGGPVFGPRSSAFGFRHRPPAAAAAGQIILDAATNYQGSTGSSVWANEDGELIYEHPASAGANRFAIVFFTMRWCATGDVGSGPDADSPPGTIHFGSQAMEFITYRARNLIFHGYYQLINPTAVGDVEVKFAPSFNLPDVFPAWWVQLHTLTFFGVKQSPGPAIRNQSSGTGIGTQASPFSPSASTDEANSWIVDSLSVDDDRTPTISPVSTTHIRRASSRITDNSGEDAWTVAHCLATGTEEHAVPGVYIHPWWWTGGSQGYTYYAIELEPAA